MTRPILFLAALVALAIPSAATAAPVPVTSGSLTWTQFNVYDTGAAENTNRTWLGYTTSTGPPFTNGSMFADAPATGAAVRPNSDKGADKGYDVQFPVAKGGTIDLATGYGSLEFAGTLRYTSQVHGFTITISNPLVVIDAAGAKLFATGTGSSGMGQSSSAGGQYDRTNPVFTLGGGSGATSGPARSVTGLVPAIATANMVWPSDYAVGAGPDRTPNTFGGFKLELKTGETTAAADAPKPAEVTQPTATTGKTTATPKVSCKKTRVDDRPRVTCEVRVAEGVAKVVAKVNGKRLAAAAAENGLARIVLARKRRKVTFAAVDAAGKTLSKKTLTVKG